MYIQQPKKNGRGKLASDVSAEATSVEAPELGPAISLTDVLRTIRKWFWVIVLVAALLVAAVLWHSLRQMPRYEASTTILVGQNSGLIQNPGDVSGLQQITETMAQAVPSRPVAEAVIQQLNLQIPPQSLIGSLKAEQLNKTQFVKITYSDSSPERAQQIVNAVGKEFSDEVSKLQSDAATSVADAYYQQAAGTGVVSMIPPTPVITATVWEQADVPGAPVSPNPKRDGLFALTLGLMLGVGLAFLLEHLTTADKWRSLDEVESISGVPTIGVIPK